MSHEMSQYDEQLIDLMIQRATTGLSESEKVEFEQMASLPLQQVEAEHYELTVTAVDLGLHSSQHMKMPREIHDRLLVAAGKFFGTEHVTTSKSDNSGQRSKPSVRKSERFRWRDAVPWAVTAACLLLMLNDLNPFSKANVIAKLPSSFQQYKSFIDAPPADLVEVIWQPIHDLDAGGKVVWSDSRQTGFMIFSGLDINDPKIEQYQLWIFDTLKDQADPVDGGVFDIAANGEVVIPIVAHIPVDNAVQFAITVERPGGVTVSKRERVPLLAAIK